MRLLFDSHAFVWHVLGHPKQSAKARIAVEEQGAEIYFSAVTAWEIAIKAKAGRWDDGADLLERLDHILTSHRFRPLPINVDHARVAGQLSGEHKDPFDRMLAAQAIIEDLILVTADRALLDLGARVLW